MYYQLYKNLLEPLYENTIKRRNILKYHRFLKETQWWPREKLQEFQWQELKRLLKHAYEQVPYWRGIMEKVGISDSGIRSFSDFQKLPIIGKDEIRSYKEKMIAHSHRGMTLTKATGGSTGIPLEFEYTPESYDWRMAMARRGYGWANCEEGMKQAYIWGAAIGEVSSVRKFKENLHYSILRKKYFNSFEFTENKMAECFKKLNQFKPEIIVGYTNPLYNFAEFVSCPKKTKFHPKGVISAVEKLHDFQRQKIREVFGADVFDTYGSREFMLIASKCERHSGLHVSVENLLVEVVKDNGQPAGEGELGGVVVTDLHNYGMPFIRYRIGDLAVATNRRCGCKRGLPLLERIEGRSLDMIKTADGRFVAGEFFPHLMKEFRGVRQFQVIQNRLDKVQVKIVRGKEWNDTGFTIMKNEINKVMGPATKVDFEFVDSIPLTATGKFRVTVSDLK